MITILEEPFDYTGTHGRNILTVQSDNTDVNRYLLKVMHNGNIVGQQYITAYDNIAIFVLRGVLSSVLKDHMELFTSLAIGNATSRPVTNHSKLVDLVVEGIDDEGQFITGETITREDLRIIKAVNTNYYELWSTNYDAYLAYDDTIKIRHCFKNQYIPITFYSKQLNRSVLINGNSIGSFPTTNGYAVALYRENMPNQVNTLSIGGSVYPDEFQIIVDDKCYPRTKTLYFLNKFGGWEWYNFIDYEVTERADKSQHTVYKNPYGDRDIYQYIDSSIKELKLWGREGVSDYITYLKEIVNSPIIYDELGNRVRVVDDNIMIDAQGIIQPEITIRYIQDYTINY